MNDSELITAVKESVADVHMNIAAEQIVSRSRQIRAVRRISGFAGALAVVAAVILAVTALVPASHQAGHHPKVQLVAWTVAKLPNGDVRVHIYELGHPAALQRKLRAEGIPASIVTRQPPVGAAPPCRQYPASQALLNMVFPGAYQRPSPPPGVFVIRPSALPRGTGVQLAGGFRLSAPPGGALARSFPPIMVYASPPCTGS